MTSVFLISSGAYVEPELEAEFGRLPPAFLPLGNRRLFVHQRRALGDAPGRLLLSLPEDFEPEPHDLVHLGRLGFEIIKVPVGLSLGQSVVYVINVTATAGADLAILHGDTLIDKIDWNETDVVSVASPAPPSYHWGYVRRHYEGIALADEDPDGEDTAVLTGFFSFGSAALLVQSVTHTGGDFLRGIVGYSQQRPLRTVRAGKWLDFGHNTTYHLSRQTVTTEREFNTLVADRRRITKSGNDHRKIGAEAHWYETLPPPLRVYTPAYLGLQEESASTSYSIEYLHLPTLSDLFVFGRLPRRAWEQMLSACDEFLTACANYPAPSADRPRRTLYLEKTLERLEAFARSTGLSLADPCRFGGAWLPTLEQMARLTASAIPEATATHLTLVHGDFCFSNILYDVRSQRVRAIDPRGLDAEGSSSPYGDRRYDIGKLHHSAVGKYDLIMAGAMYLERHGPLDFELKLPDSESTRAVREVFLAHSFAGLSLSAAAAHPISILLFLSMLPLHSDGVERQLALLANAMRLFLELDAGRLG